MTKGYLFLSMHVRVQRERFDWAQAHLMKLYDAIALAILGGTWTVQLDGAKLS
jgi:hypothetical protein